MLTLNEIEGVRALVPKLPTDVADDILAVDGGSTDGTREFLQTHGIKVVGQEKRGRGEAFRIAVNAALGNHLVFFSPDGNEDWRDIPRLFQAVEAGADLAIASRFLPGARNEEDDAKLPLRKWANQTFTLLANLLWNRGRPYVSDTINGFRATTKDAFHKLRAESSGYTIEYEMTIHAMKQQLRITEIPTIEGTRIGGRTKGPSLEIGPQFLKCLVKEFF